MPEPRASLGGAAIEPSMVVTPTCSNLGRVDARRERGNDDHPHPERPEPRARTSPGHSASTLTPSRSPCPHRHRDGTRRCRERGPAEPVAYVTLELVWMEEALRRVSTSSPRRRDRRRGGAGRQRWGFPSEPEPSCPSRLRVPSCPALEDAGSSPGGPDRSGHAVLRHGLQPFASMGAGRHRTARPAIQVARVGQALGPLPHAAAVKAWPARSKRGGPPGEEALSSDSARAVGALSRRKLPLAHAPPATPAKVAGWPGGRHGRRGLEPPAPRR